MAKRTAMAMVVAMVLGLVGLLGPGPTAAGAQTATPSITVTPSTGLVHQQTVQVTGSGFAAGVTVGILTCPAGATAGGCSLPPDLAVTQVAADGTFTLDVRVNRYASADVDCTSAPCELLAWALNGQEARQPVTFAAVEEPQLTVAIDPYGTVDDAGVAVVSAVISCDRPTGVSAVGELGQDTPWGDPGPFGGFSLTDQCTPEEPVWAFFPIRTTGDDDDPGGPWLVGTARLSVGVRPTSPAGIPDQWEFAEVTLLDQEPLAEAIRTALADPSEVELRATIVRAIQERVQQDPIFAAEWRALLAG